MLFVFDDMISGILSNKKFKPILSELFIRGRKLNISLVLITQSYFAVPKKIRLNLACNFVMKIPSKREFHQILTFKTAWIFKKVYCKIIFFFGCWYYSYIR